MSLVINATVSELEAIDTKSERFNKVELGLGELLKWYKEIYQEKEITKYFTLTRSCRLLYPESRPFNIQLPFQRRQLPYPDPLQLQITK